MYLYNQKVPQRALFKVDECSSIHKNKFGCYVKFWVLNIVWLKEMKTVQRGNKMIKENLKTEEKKNSSF